ncbi:MAG: hypothetical protein ACPL1D_01255 [Microgenomates group bacterium]
MTLTELAYYSRRLLPLVVLGFLFLLIIFYLFKISFFFLSLNKPQTIYHNPIFGKIDLPKIKNATSSAGFEYLLDTIEGSPITATTTAKVFFIPPAKPRLGYREKAFLMAKNFNIDTNLASYNLKNNQAIFTDEKQKLIVDIDTFNFSYQYFFENDPSLLENIVIPEQKTIENKVIDFLKTINRYPDDLALGRININLINYDPISKIFTKVKQSNEANMVEVNLFRSDIDNFPIITPNFPSSQNYFLVVFNEQGFKILRAQIKFFEKSNEEYGIYLLNSGEKIYEKLKNGLGFVINHPSTNKKIVIKNMFLGYFDPDEYQPYLQPVYVFVGEPDFTAYVPAISDQYLQ